MRIRTVSADADAAAIAAIYAPIVRDTAISFETDPPDAEAMAARIAAALERYPWLVAEAEGRVLGYAYAGPHRTRPAYRWSCDVTIYVDADGRRRGTGRALYARLLEILTAQRFTAAYAGVALPNPASIALHEALGFAPIGVFPAVGFKRGAWRDVGWWRRPLAAPETPPAAPIAFPDLPTP